MKGWEGVLSFVGLGKFQDINIPQWLVTDISQQKPGFDSRPGKAGIVVDTMVLGQVFLQTLRPYSSASFHQCSILTLHLSQMLYNLSI